MYNEMFCKNCGKIALPDVKFCEYCDTRLDATLFQAEETAQSSQQLQYDTSQYELQAQYPSYQQPSYIPRDQSRLPRKSPEISAILSLLIAGLGQIYLGSFWYGAVWFIGAAWCIGALFLGIISGGILAIFVWIGAAIDAYLLAKNYNRKLGYSE
jgi:TM2 domain-containing membrane protein YozV